MTVVATGLGKGAQQEESKPMKLIHKKASGEVDYEQLDRPTVIRNQVAGERFATGTDANIDYLDIPAFLRRQAD